MRGLFSLVSQNGGVFFSGTPLAGVIRFTNDIIRMPRKYRTRIGQRGLTLSKGQQQRGAGAGPVLVKVS